MTPNTPEERGFRKTREGVVVSDKTRLFGK